MKNISLLVFIFTILLNHILAQKPSIDFNTYKKWVSINGPSISKNGQYVMFIIENEPIGSKTLVIKPINGKWEKKIIGQVRGEFTNDGKSVLLNRSNTLTLLNLKENKEENVANDKMVAKAANNEIKIYKAITALDRIIIENQQTKQKDSIDNVTDYIITPQKNAFIISIKNNQKGTYSLIWYDIKTKYRMPIWESFKNQEVMLDHNKVTNHILFKLKEPAPSINTALAAVDVWSYKDAKDPQPFAQQQKTFDYNYAINFNGDHKVIQLTSSNERIVSINNDFVLTEKNLGNNPFEALWNNKSKSSFYLTSLKNGFKKLIIQQTGERLINATFSPNGQFILISNEETMHYYSYNLLNNEMTDLSKQFDIHTKTIDMGFKMLDFSPTWTLDNSFIICDDYDLWKVDLTGKQPPINLTAGYGRANQVVFKLIQTSKSSKLYREISKDLNGYLLNAFDEKDKSWGFYKLSNLSGEIPIKLSMGQYYYGGNETRIIRANETNSYIVIRETAKESPNLFFTNDFKTFRQLSNITPEKDYNWMSTELVKWKAYNNKMCDGILYKPENFDASKKYPTVVLIYNEFSSKINRFPDFRISELGFLNELPISWLVSNGYLVFIPDIIYRKQGPRLQDSYDMAISGVEYISNKSYINRNKIGLEGASWGGEQAYYFVTHTNIFAAAFIGSGLTERIIDYGFTDPYVPNSNLMANEMNYGGNLTEVSKQLIKEAPLLSADKVETPILIKHNKDDGVAFYQGFQFFQILRRLGKKAWMLQYDSGGHGIEEGKDYEDIELRIAQFFGYYLKSFPAPIWMTQGIAPEKKQIDHGLELDTSLCIP